MSKKKTKSKKPQRPYSARLSGIQHTIFHTQLVLILLLATMLGIAWSLVNLHFENEKRDRNLQNIAEAISHLPTLGEDIADLSVNESRLVDYFDTLRDALADVDVISLVSADGTRLYHSNHELIGTVYDGSIPDFSEHSDGYYATDESGPSGKQRRAYAAIYDDGGKYLGFVMAIMLKKNIRLDALRMLVIFIIITSAAIFTELIVASRLSESVKKSLMGYEPDVFSAMYRTRDNILEALNEGILAADDHGVVQFANSAAARMLCGDPEAVLAGKSVDDLGDTVLSNSLSYGELELSLRLGGNGDILLDRRPILDGERTVGALAVLHDRAEYTRLMEDLAGTRYLVDSMRANNHDFTNKLHVILGLIQMEMYDEATSYIQNITMVQRENISRVMNAVSEPAVAALLIGKIARASELNIRFLLCDDCRYDPSDIRLPSEMLITVIGNLLDNAFDAMNEPGDLTSEKTLTFDMRSRPGALKITIEDTGSGIAPEDIERIFENGYSTKGEGRGTGLYQVKAMIEATGGKITVSSEKNKGSRFRVGFGEDKNDV